MFKKCKCCHSFLSLPFCSKCGDKLYDGTINISKSMIENKLIFNSDDEENNKPYYLLTEDENLKLIQQKLAYSKHLIDEMITNMDDKCILNDNIRKLNSAVQQAFFILMIFSFTYTSQHH